VRLQVTLLPLARNQPYDAYTSISLFGGPWALGSGVGEYKIAGDLVKEPKPKHFQVEAVPLLVTDDLEAALRSRSVDELRQTALALAAAFGNIGGLGNVEQTDEELRTVAGRDLNSTFTVARVNDNTVLCRFGALYQATAHYAMVPQTHNVTLLVLVPRDQAVLEPGVDRRVRLSSLTTLVDAETGEQLPGRGWNDVRRKVEAVFRDHDFPVSGAGLDVLLYRVAENNYDDFLTAALAVSGKQRLSYPESLWSDLSSIRRGSQYASASFDVPRRQTRLPAAEQSPVFADDTKSAIGVTLRGGKGLDATELSAMLSVGDVHLAATALKVVEGREVTLTFPSLKLLKLDGSKAVLELKQGAQTSAWDCAKAGCQFVEPATAAPAAKASFGMAVRVKNLRSSGDGKGKLQLVFTVAKDATPDIHFTVEGADVDEVTPAGSVIAKDDGWNLGRSATVTLALSNLSPFSPVLVNAGDGTSKASASVPVLAIDSKK